MNDNELQSMSKNGDKGAHSIEQLGHFDHVSLNQYYPLSLIVHDFKIARNIGSVFRIADALGVERIYLTGCSFDADNPKVKKASRTTVKSVPYESHDAVIPIIQKLKRSGYTIISLEMTSKSIAVSQLELPPASKVCLILGAEKEGVAENLLVLSDHVVHIPVSYTHLTLPTKRIV